MFVLYLGQCEKDNEEIQREETIKKLQDYFKSQCEKDFGVDFTVYIHAVEGAWGGRCANAEKCLKLELFYNQRHTTYETALTAFKQLRNYFQKEYDQSNVPAYINNYTYVPKHENQSYFNKTIKYFTSYFK
jgi:hypothetical protein